MGDLTASPDLELHELAVVELALMLPDWREIIEALSDDDARELLDNDGFWIRPDGTDTRVLIEA